MISFFFGAGASMCLGLPDMKGLREKLTKRCSDNQTHLAILRQYESETVETLYGDIDQLLSLKNNKIMVACAHKLHNCDIDHEKMLVELKALRTEIRNTMLDLLDVSSEQCDPYCKMLTELGIGNQVWDIITTNYDLVLDRCIANEMVDGFAKDEYANMRFNWQNDWDKKNYSTRVVKLHGSINWQRGRETPRPDGLFGQPHPDIEKSYGPGHRKENMDVMILPTPGKKDYSSQPFDKLYEQFMDIVEKSKLLVAIGYSFKDEGINDILKNQLEKQLRILSIGPKAYDETAAAFGKSVQVCISNDVPYVLQNADRHVYAYEHEFYMGCGKHMRSIIAKICNDIDGTQTIEYKPMNKKERKQCR